jgi:precorrin-6B methylase 2
MNPNSASAAACDLQLNVRDFLKLSRVVIVEGSATRRYEHSDFDAVGLKSLERIKQWLVHAIEHEAMVLSKCAGHLSVNCVRDRRIQHWRLRR